MRQLGRTDLTTRYLYHCNEIVIASNLNVFVMSQHTMRHPHSCFLRKLCTDRKFFKKNFHLSGHQEPGSGQGLVEGSCEHGNKPSSSIKCRFQGLSSVVFIKELRGGVRKQEFSGVCTRITRILLTSFKAFN
jgi:hypothetical protein